MQIAVRIFASLSVVLTVGCLFLLVVVIVAGTPQGFLPAPMMRLATINETVEMYLWGYCSKYAPVNSRKCILLSFSEIFAHFNTYLEIDNIPKPAPTSLIQAMKYAHPGNPMIITMILSSISSGIFTLFLASWLAFSRKFHRKESKFTLGFSTLTLTLVLTTMCFSLKMYPKFARDLKILSGISQLKPNIDSGMMMIFGSGACILLTFSCIGLSILLRSRQEKNVDRAVEKLWDDPIYNYRIKSDPQLDLKIKNSQLRLSEFSDCSEHSPPLREPRPMYTPSFYNASKYSHSDIVENPKNYPKEMHPKSAMKGFSSQESLPPLKSALKRNSPDSHQDCEPSDTAIGSFEQQLALQKASISRRYANTRRPSFGPSSLTFDYTRDSHYVSDSSSIYFDLKRQSTMNEFALPLDGSESRLSRESTSPPARDLRWSSETWEEKLSKV